MTDLENQARLEVVNSLPSTYATALGQNLKVKAIQGPSNIFYERLESTNGASLNTKYLINLTPNQYISDRILEEINYKVTITYGNAPTGNVAPFPAGSLSVCMLPNMAISNTDVVKFQNENLTCQTSKIYSSLFAYNNNFFETNGFDFVDSEELDCFVDPADLAGSSFKKGALKNPRANYSSTPNGTQSRFDLQWQPVTTAGATANAIGFDNANITTAGGANQVREVFFKSTTPIFNGLFSLTRETEGCFTNLTTIELSRTLNTNLGSRILQYLIPAGITVASVNVTCVGSPVIYYKLYSMPSYIPRPITSSYLAYDYGNLSTTKVTSNIGALGSGTDTQTITTSNIMLNSVPRAIYVWVADDLDSATGYSNVSCPGTKVVKINSIQLGGNLIVQNLVSDVQIYDLLENGLKKTFIETGFVLDNSVAGTVPYPMIGLHGSILRIDCSQLSLQWDSVCNTVNKSYSLSISLQVQNLSSRACSTAGAGDRRLNLYVLPVNERILSISNGVAFSQNSFLTEEEVRSLRANSQLVPYKNINMIGGRMLAGSFWDDVWSGMKSVGNTVADAGKWAWDHKSDIADAAKYALPLVGLGKKSHKKPVHRGRGIDEHEYNDDLEGGAVLTKTEMKNKLKFI